MLWCCLCRVGWQVTFKIEFVVGAHSGWPQGCGESGIQYLRLWSLFWNGSTARQVRIELIVDLILEWQYSQAGSLLVSKVNAEETWKMVPE